MCLSPHEMNSADLEEDIATLRARLESGYWGGRRITHNERKRWEWRIEHMEELLKERAEAGTYGNDFASEAYR